MDLDSLGTACWRNPYDVAEYHRFAPGKFWLGRCPITGTPLGHSDDRHVLLVSGTRAGKGTDIIIPNLCLWEGSAVVIDPKGENATITAARRGGGSDYCEGMGQTVYVVDPFRVARVEDRYRARFNPLDALDVTAPDFITKLKGVAVALMPLAKEESDTIWIKVGRRLLMQLIMHVLTCEDFEGRRNLVTVRRLLLLGDYEMWKTLVDAGEKEVPSAVSLLWESMRMNDALGGAVSSAGQQYIDNIKNNPKRNEDTLMNAREETDFLDAQQFAQAMECSDFSLDEIKSAPNGVTIYLCLPFDQIDAYFPWLRLMVTLSMNAVQVSEDMPACGHRTLFCLDEFAALEQMKNVESSISQIAGYHVTMFLVLQSLVQLKNIYRDGWEVFLGNCALKLFFGLGDQFTLKYVSELMGEREVLRVARSASTTEALATGRTTSRQHTKSASETHGTTHTVSHSESKTVNQTLSYSRQRTKSLAEQRTQSESRTQTRQDSRSHAQTQTIARGGGESAQWGENWSKTLGKHRGVSSGEQTSWNASQGGGSSKSEGWADPGHGILGDTGKYLPFLREKETVNYQTQENWSAGRGGGKNTGRSSGSSESDSRGGSSGGSENTSWTESDAASATVGESVSDGETSGTSRGTTESASEGETEGRSLSTGSSTQDGTSDAVSHSVQTGVSDTEGVSDTITETISGTEGEAETVHKRPLLTPDEIGVCFGRPDEVSKPGEPAWALVLLDGERPAVVHRSPYHRDVGFQWLSDAHPRYEPGPKLIGPISEPVPRVRALELKPYAPSVTWLVKEGVEVQRGESLLTLGLPSPARFLSPAFIGQHQGEIGDVLTALSGKAELTASKLDVPVFSPATGVLSKQAILTRKTDGGLEAFVEIVGNRRRHLEAQEVELPIPMIDYFKYLKELHAQQREEEEAERERDRAEEEERERKAAIAAAQYEEERLALEERRAQAAAAKYKRQWDLVHDTAGEDWWQGEVTKHARTLRVFLISIACLIVWAVLVFTVRDAWIFKDYEALRLPNYEGPSDYLRDSTETRTPWSFWVLLVTPLVASAIAVVVCLAQGGFGDHLERIISRGSRDRTWRHMWEPEKKPYIDARIAQLEED